MPDRIPSASPPPASAPAGRARLRVGLAAAVLVAVGACDPAESARDAGVASRQASPDRQAVLTADSAYLMDALRHLSSDAMEGRGTGTPGAARARAFLVDELEEAGVGAFGDSFERPFTWSRRGEITAREGVNVVAVVPGTGEASGALVVSAHYDHVGVRDGTIYNGADDDASGTVALLALARALRAAPLRHTVVLAAFDAEEVGLRGARAFVEEPPLPLDSIVLNVNMDMVARTAGLLWAAGAHHTPALRPALERVAAVAPLELRLGHDAPDAPGGDDWTRASDHAAFHEAGIPFVYLGVEDHADYHRPTDDFENVNPGEYMNALRTALMLLVELDAADSPTGAGARPAPEEAGPGAGPEGRR